MTTARTFMKRHPELAAEWSEKNFPHRAEDEPSHSKEKRWWKCSVCGNEWQAQTAIRAQGKTSCPYCSNRKVKKGLNDLESRYPHIAAEWDPEKNGDLKPDMVVYGSARRVWWKCKKGHSWAAAISCRTQGGTGCPYCARKEAEKGVNDTVTVYPELVSWWSPGNKLKPDEVRSDYPGHVLWICPECGTEYKSRIRIQHRMGEERCPYCRGRYVRRGTNDIATTDPWVLAEWDYKRNAGVSPEEVTRKSDRSVRWKCSKGHEWSASIRERIVDGKGCPYCNGELQEKKKEEAVISKPEKESVPISVYRKGNSNQDSVKELPVWEKYALGVKEAAGYFVISESKLHHIIRNNPDADYLIWSGRNVYFIREKFEKYLDGQEILQTDR